MHQTVADLISGEKSEESWFRRKIIANAPFVIVIFANFVVIFADVRAYHVVFQLTGIWWQALGASLACAIPFLLWEIGWQYNYTTDNWRRLSLLMAGLAFVTSIVLGIADYIGMSSIEWANLLLALVVLLTGVHTIMGFLYFYNDPDVARKRRKAQALAKMDDQRINAQVARQLLRDGRGLMDEIRKLEGEFTAEEVEQVMAILNNKKLVRRISDNSRDKISDKPQDPTQGRF